MARTSHSAGKRQREAEKAAARALEELDGVELDGRPVRVNLATERPR